MSLVVKRCSASEKICKKIDCLFNENLSTKKGTLQIDVRRWMNGSIGG